MESVIRQTFGRWNQLELEIGDVECGIYEIRGTKERAFGRWRFEVRGEKLEAKDESSRFKAERWKRKAGRLEGFKAGKLVKPELGIWNAE